MTDVDIAGLGVWSEHFSNWDGFCAVLAGSAGTQSAALTPELIPPKERRRAPLAVKMAVEVMDQACRMAAVEPSEVATVFASGMGDMQITDYMCRTLATSPRMISPTKFHNSVHNASTGYWSIATHSHSPANAISGYSHSAAVAILEGAVQAVEEEVPVLVAVLEMAAPAPFKSVYDSDHPFSAALLLTPAGYHASPVASVRLGVASGAVDDPPLPTIHGVDLSNNFAARLLSLFTAIAQQGNATLQFPLSRNATLSLSIAAGHAVRTANA
ncbi:MAG: beta-ketoacyl synthase chain length factor [Gammaproteobacteria bacterium]|nr:beta-ketoacyl synthase chain length factor [Gammaproteobacteria bacterium]MDH3372038.1 beta-ketoacyl synthase chain length factor [Gammaproteobacteria bacterium]MDH3407835.1 beta-ketoacyl synthase chain length factor [Gammaproteobacteria bacterium]MDH3552000.1 beta-ketoacyl synthase chain length factor [Gammaproteobacteria bacterium]